MRNIVWLSVGMIASTQSYAAQSVRDPLTPATVRRPVVEQGEKSSHVPLSAAAGSIDGRSVSASTAPSVAMTSVPEHQLSALIEQLRQVKEGSAKLLLDRNSLSQRLEGASSILTGASALLGVGTQAQIPAAVQAVQARLTVAETSLSQLSMLLGAAGEEDPIVKARGINQRINRLEAVLGVEEGGDILAAASRLRETNATATAAHAADITALRADFEARMATQVREHAAALGLVQQEVASLRTSDAEAQARIADLTAKLAQSESYGAAATDLLGTAREAAQAAEVIALTAKSTAAGAHAEALEKFLSQPAKVPAKGPRAARGYGAADSARQPLLAAEHPGASVEARDLAATLAALREKSDDFATQASAVGSRSLTPPRDAIGKKLADPSYTGTFGIFRSPLRGRGAGTTGSIN